MVCGEIVIRLTSLTGPAKSQNVILALPSSSTSSIFILEELLYCVCQNDRAVYLRLRGLCKNSYFDTYWVPKNILNLESNNSEFTLGNIPTNVFV